MENRLYTVQQTADFQKYRLRYLIPSFDGHALTLTLNRPEKKNALHPALLNELAFALTYAHDASDVWMVVLAAAGDTFCAAGHHARPNRPGFMPAGPNADRR